MNTQRIGFSRPNYVSLTFFLRRKCVSHAECDIECLSVRTQSHAWCLTLFKLMHKAMPNAHTVLYNWDGTIKYAITNTDFVFVDVHHCDQEYFRYLMQEDNKQI